MTRWLLVMRLRWYGEATALLLRRRWQLILLLVGTLAPVGGSLLGVASYPVLTALAKHYGAMWRLLTIGTWQAFSVLWALMQRDQLRGGQFSDYLRTFPISARAARAIDSILLLLSNTPLLLPFIAAGIKVGTQGTQVPNTVLEGLFTTFLLTSLFCAQHEALAGHWRALLTFVIADICVVIALALPDAWAIPLILAALVSAVLALLTHVPHLPAGLGGRFRPLIASFAQAFGGATLLMPPLYRISFGILYRQHRATLLGTFVVCLLVTFAARSLLRIWDFDERSTPLVLIALGIIALCISGLYRPLQMAHAAARPYTAALPLRPGRWVAADTLSLVGVALPFAALTVMPLWLNAGISVEVVAAVAASFFLLIASLRIPQLFSSQHAVIASTSLAVVWTFAATSYLCF